MSENKTTNIMKNNRSIGIAVVVTSETEFNHVKQFLTPEVCWIDWQPKMAEIETAITLKANKNSDFSVGGVGSAEYKRVSGIKTVPFSENLVQYLIN
jgi:hypothetical protein